MTSCTKDKESLPLLLSHLLGIVASSWHESLGDELVGIGVDGGIVERLRNTLKSIPVRCTNL
jgi:hypothetical protein